MMPPSDKASDHPAEQVDLSSLFMRRYKHSGRHILRPIWFYISLNKNGYAATKRLITHHGGKVSAELGDKKTSREICLVDPHSKASRDGRPAFSVDFIQSCISAKRLLDIEDFRILPVGRTRRTPPKKRLLASDRKRANENDERRVDDFGTSELAQTKDSEVTDDLPCVVLPEKGNETHEQPVSGSQLVTGVPLGEMVLQKVDDTDRREVDEKGERKVHHRTQAKSHDRKPGRVTPKKRKSPEGIAEKEERGRETDPQEAPSQPVTPIKDTINWSKMEDNVITELCIDTKQVYHDTNRDPNNVFTLPCWELLEEAKLLPTGRSANACFERAKELWKNGDTENAVEAEKVETAARVETHGRSTKRARFSPPQTGGYEDEDKIVENRDQPQTPNPPALHGKLDKEQGEPKVLKDANRHETREYIFELVARIAKRGRVTKRKAFRALRDERGHWKRALRLVTRRREANNS